MSHTTPPQELINAYKLLKAGKRKEAGQQLKTYLAQNPNNADAWWLMSFTVGTPDQVEKCLRAALKSDPHHEKARAKLAELSGPVPDAAAPDAAASDDAAASSAPVSPDASAPPAAPPPATSTIEEPDERLFFETMRTDPRGESRPRSAVVKPLSAAPPEPSPALQAAAFSMPLDDLADDALPARPASTVSFAEFAATVHIQRDPFSGEPLHSPFATIPPDDDPFAELSAPDADAAQTTGTDGPRSTGRTGADHLLALIVAVFAVLVLVSFVLYALDQGGTISLNFFDSKTAMTELNAASFAIEYPEGWDHRCRYEALGYQVCGIANHALYNDVDWFVDQQVDIGAMLQAAFSAPFAGSVPDEQISIVVMDVPMNSSSYDDGSWAKTLYEYYQQGWAFEPDTEVTYNGREDITIDGYTAYYYKYTSAGLWKDAAWDVYIPHDGIVFWMRATFSGERGDRIPQHIIDDMIASIDINPQ